MVGERLLDEQDLPAAVLVDARAVAQRVLDDDGVPVGLAGVVEVELAAVARERHAEQAPLALVDHLVGDVEQRRGLELVGELALVVAELVLLHLDQPDAPALLGDVEVGRAGPGGQRDGLVERGDLLDAELDRVERGRGAAPRWSWWSRRRSVVVGGRRRGGGVGFVVGAGAASSADGRRARRRAASSAQHPDQALLHDGDGEVPVAR